MTEEIIFKASVNTGNTVEELKKVSNAAKGAGDEIDKTNEKQQKQLDAINKKVESGTLSRRELTKAVKEYQTVALQAGEASPIGQAAIQAAGELSDRLGDLDAQIRVMGHDGANMQAALQLGSTITAGYGALQGTMALLGGDTDALTESMVKLQAVQTTLASIEEIRAALEQESFLMIKAQVLWTNLQAAASNKLTIAEIAKNGVMAVTTAVTAAATSAMAALNAVMLLNPVFLLIAAFAAIAGAIALFASSTDHAAEDNERLNESIERSNELLEISNEKMIRTANNRLKQAQAEGASEEELLQKRLAVLKSEEVARKNNMAELKKQAYQRIAVMRQAMMEGDEDTQKAAEEEIRSLTSKYNRLKALDGQYYADRRAMITEFNRERQKQEMEDEQELIRGRILAARGNFAEQQRLRKELAAKERDEALRDVNVTEAEKYRIQQEYEQKVYDLNQESADRSKKAREERRQKQKEEAQKDLELERLISDMAVANITDEWQRRFTQLAIGHQREREELIAKYGNDTRLMAELAKKQSAELLALDAEQEASIDAKEKEAEKKRIDKENADARARLEGEMLAKRNDFEARNELAQELALLERDQALQNKELTEGEKFKIEQEYQQKIDALRQEQRDNEEATNQAIITSRQAMAGAIAGLASSIAGALKEGTAAQKVAALTEIGINTAVGFVNGLRIAQQTAAAAGPGAAFAFPIFYAQQLAAVIGAANKAKDILKAGPTVSAPSATGSSGSPGSPAPSVSQTLGNNSSNGTSGIPQQTQYIPVLPVDSLKKVQDQSNKAEKVATLSFGG